MKMARFHDPSHDGVREKVSCPSWARTRTLLIQSQGASGESSGTTEKKPATGRKRGAGRRKSTRHPSHPPRQKTLKIDRRFRGVGRITRASGTNIPSIFAALDKRLTELAERGDLATLRALRDCRIEPLALLTVPIEDIVLLEEDRQLFLYVIRRADTRELKIGVSLTPKRRVAALQGAHGEPLELLLAVPCKPHRESEIHRRFAAHRKLGEWFRECPEIIEWIKAEKKSHGSLRVSPAWGLGR